MNRTVCEHFNPVDQECRQCAALAEPQTTHWEGCEAVHPECRKVEQAVKAEREQCAQVAEKHWDNLGIGQRIATAIRSRT